MKKVLFESNEITKKYKLEYDKVCLNIIMDSNFYEELTENPNILYEEKFRKEIQNILHEKLITKNEYDILLEGTKTPSFYAKPKTHETYQEIQLFRPICNGIGSYFVCMPEFIDSFFQPLSRKNSLYVKDTTDFLNEVSKIHNSPET